MTKALEVMTIEDKLHEAFKHRRLQRRVESQLTGIRSKNADGDDQDKPLRRGGIDANGFADRLSQPSSHMRVLLRNAKTMKFFRTGESWTKNPKDAMDFRNGWWATVQAFTMNPRHLVIHYEFEDDRYNLHIPVLGH